MLAVTLAVSIFFQGATAYAFEMQQQEYEKQQEMIENVQETAATLESQLDIQKRKIAVMNYKKLAAQKEADRKRKEQEERRIAAAANIVAYANQFVGRPYVWGGNSLANGCDCSHFVYNVLKDTGNYSGGYTTSRNWASLGTEVGSIEQAKQGDIVVYHGHVAIYDGNGLIIEAQSSRAGITNNRSVTSATIVAIRRFI